ncbi:uncharacterized protein LOC126204003 [Schistocerca nitens]|uniref:uncharacterized protein LOC126204003 n=1 Tax=Schistocerca nitens TaxID=7011 RepID=UPI0021191799|nr:uncharacterized protein LOC126204003 [Schistocerca nitens]
MSRRPQVLRVTDSANSVLTPRRSPGTPPTPPPAPAVVATLTTCPAAAPPPLDAKAMRLHQEAALSDASFRALSCKDGESPAHAQSQSQCHSLERGARFGLHRSVPGRLDAHSQGEHDQGGSDSQQQQEPLEAALDGLARYLQSNRQGLRDLLLTSALVVVEPLPARARTCRIAGATVKAASAHGPPPPGAAAGGGGGAAVERAKSYTIPRALRFFHPKRHNRELLDEELPDPDTVRRARQVFEATLAAGGGGGAAPTPPASGRRALSAPGRRWTDCGSVSSGVSSDLSSSYEARSSRGSDSDRGSGDDDDDDEDEEDAGRGGSPAGEARVSGEVLERIRARGLSVTYYGGRVVARTPAPPPVAAVLSEIGGGGGAGFRLVKSHSCGSRLQLAADVGSSPSEVGPVFTSTLGDVSLRPPPPQEEPKSRKSGKEAADSRLAAYCGGGVAAQPRRYPDMEFEEFQVLEDGAGVQGQRGAVCGAA